MVAFIIEAVALCAVFTVSCVALAGKIMDHLELAKLNYPEPIVRRLIELGKVSGEKPLSLAQRVKKKWPILIVLGVLLGLVVRYINGCTSFLSAFLTSYLLWTVVDWYDALVLDCLWFCHSPRCVIPGTEDLTEAYHDYRFHIKGSLVGMLIGLPGCLIAGLTATLLG